MSVRILDNIRNHQDLEKLNPQQRTQLCAELREFLVDSISRTGGHLASNLGVVELTVALETVFDIDGARVKSANPYMITVEIPYTVREREGKTTLLLVREQDQWRFDGPAY